MQLQLAIIENALILISELFFISSNAAQLAKLMKTKDRHGLSAINQTLNGAGNIAWATYFFSRQFFVPFTTNLTMLVITATMLGFTLGNKKQFVRGVIAIAIVGPLTGLLLLRFPAISGWIGVVYNVIAMMPWIIRVLRIRRTSGLSGRSIYLAIGALGCSLAYAILTHSTPLIVGASIGFSMNLLVLFFYYAYRNADLEPKVSVPEPVEVEDRPSQD